MDCHMGKLRWIIGIASLVVIFISILCGLLVYMNEKDKNWAQLINNNIPFIFILISMCLAVVVALYGFLLCCCKDKCVYITYIIFIIIVALIEVGGIALAFSFKDRFIDDIQMSWKEQKKLQKRQKVENDFQCCGFKNSDDDNGDCGYSPGDGKHVGTCFEKIKKEVNNHFYSLRAASIAMCVFEVALLICACYVTCCLKNSEQKVEDFDQ